jgi:hypothetical protein
VSPGVDLYARNMNLIYHCYTNALEPCDAWKPAIHLKSLLKQGSIAMTVFDKGRKSPNPHRSRIHLLAAREVPIIVILQRKRAKLFHVITVGTEKHWINEGSWFRGVLYALDSDVSFDGKFMVYRARGANYQTWSGVCRLPWLKTLVHVETPTTGGGYFSGPNDLKTHGWGCCEKIVSSDDIRFTIERDPKRHFGDELAVIYARFERDGFTLLDHPGEEQTFTSPTYRDDGWGRRPARGYPELQMRCIGYFNHGFEFAITLDEHPDLLVGANWAAWDSGNNLWVARPGIVEQYTLDDLRRGTPSFSLDVDRFEPPPKPDQEA